MKNNIKEILKSRQFPGITNVRRNFGINKAFYISNGKEITTWKQWEKAGYSNPLDSSRLSSDIKQKIKQKINKINIKKGKKKSFLIETIVIFLLISSQLVFGEMPGETLKEISDYIVRNCITQEEQVIALREYIYENIKPDYKLGRPAEILKPLERLRRGVGWCNHQAEIFMYLAKEQGITTRLIFLLNEMGTSSPHTIAEARINDRWVVVDIGNNVDFRNEYGEMATRLEMQQNFDIVLNNPRLKELAEKENAIFKDKNYLSAYWNACIVKAVMNGK